MDWTATDFAALLDDDLRSQMQGLHLADPLVRNVLAVFLTGALARHDIAVPEAWLNQQLDRFVVRVREEWPDVLQRAAELLEQQHRQLH